jgi:hypothetical protein
MKCVIVSACYAIIAALISKIYLIFSSVSVSWNLTVFTSTKSGVTAGTLQYPKMIMMY